MKSLSLLSQKVFAKESIKKNEAVKAVLQVVGASLLLTIAAQVRIPLFFTPVPITGQTFAAMMIGALLGPKKGALSVLLYILEGICGAPVFQAAHSGLLYFMGVTCGYIVGLVAQSFITGAFFSLPEHVTKRKLLAVLTLSSAVQMTLGMCWFASFVGISRAFELGVLPFVIGELFKILVAASLIQAYSYLKK